MLTVEEIISRMRLNYEPVIQSLPPELQEECRTRALPLAELEELAPFIHTSTEFEGRACTGLTYRKIGRKVAMMAFNKKLITAGIRPDDILGGLLKNCFVFD